MQTKICLVVFQAICDTFTDFYKVTCTLRPSIRAHTYKMLCLRSSVKVNVTDRTYIQPFFEIIHITQEHCQIKFTTIV